MTGLEVSICGVKLDHPLMNAAGTIKTLEDVKRIAPSATAAVMVGSITARARSGNEGNVYWSSPDFSLNSLGLPNPGLDYYAKHLVEMVSIAHDCGKQLFVSVAGFNPDEYRLLAQSAAMSGADLVELNLACPNVWDGKSQKRVACFDPKEVEEILHFGIGGVPLAVKLSPFSDPCLLSEVADVIVGQTNVKVVTAVNCFPNAITFDDLGNPRTAPGGGLAGLGGRAMKAISLGQVAQLRKLFPERIQIIGVGGVSNGRDVLDFQKAGAALTQTNTAYSDEGEGVFGRILKEYVEFI